MNRQMIWSIGLLGGALVLAYLLVALRPEPVEDERVEQAPLVEIVPLEAASGPIPVLASGTVQAREEVTVGVQVSGRLTYVNPAFREGGVVGAGATLLRIDQSDYLNTVRIAQADVAAQDVSVLQAQEEVTIARAELDRFAAREQATSAVGTGTQILPPSELAPASAAAREPVEADSTTSGGLATREPQLRSAEAARERAAASLADAELALSRTRVAAPFRGLVRQEDAAVGSLVQPGQALGSIVSTASYEVRLSLTPDEAALIPGLLEPGNARTSATVTYEYGGLRYRWPAFVDRASAILDASTRNVEVFLRVPSPLTAGRPVDADAEVKTAPPLLLGAFVEAEITGASLESYAAVPAQAVRPGNEIWVVRDKKLRVLKVRVIQRSDAFAFIAFPSLEQGGQLVTSSLTAPIEGMAVRVTGASAE